MRRRRSKAWATWRHSHWAGEGVEEAGRALEHGAGTREAGAGEKRGAQARLRRPARVHALGPAAVGEVLDDAGGHRAGDAERIGELLEIELERRADAGGSR